MSTRLSLLFPPVVILGLLLSGCATLSPEARLRAGLEDAGLSSRMAGCMARRMVDRLSLDQLRRLRSLEPPPGAGIGAMSLDRFLHAVRALDDPEIAIETSKAAIGCAL